MPQLAKTIYFPDYPKAATGRSGLTVPFPEATRDAYTDVAHLSSYSIRELIGFDSFVALESAARRKETSTAVFVRELLLEQIGGKRKSETPDYRVALQATFQGGRGSPLHDWYPYLEGYSPDFVNSIIDKFAPDAATILDPFCGSGTTALTAALRKLRGFYCEVNPVCRYIIESKLRAVRLAPLERERAADALEILAHDIDSRLTKTKPNPELRRAFRDSFSASKFFDARTFEHVLRLRTIADALGAKDSTVGQLFTVAVVRSLVPGSLLIRRGDLRFRTKDELERNPPRFFEELQTSLHRIASDLHDAPLTQQFPELVCSDARVLAQHLREPVDAIISSPPYLNGTNYFRNTKIELWFLRELSTKAGLRTLRDAAITCGINDVTQRKVNGTVFDPTPALKKVVNSFSKSFYDVRIPLMVRAYFNEMQQVIANFQRALKSNGTVVIDLGDSCYGSVWVPTDQILAEMMDRAGFELFDRVVLRERQSRDGRKLSQTLQVFRKTGGTRRQRQPKIEPPTDLPVLETWATFKNTLPHQTGEMAKRNWGHSLHSLCSYQGKLKPAIAHGLVRTLLRKTEARVLDPFAGVGTIPFEAQLLGHRSYAFDINPAALAITRAKLEPIDSKNVAKLLAELGALLASAEPDTIDLAPIKRIRFNGPLPDYFHAQTLAEIATAREFFRKNPPSNGARAMVFAAMLHILHGNRPYALSRRSHPITPFAPTGPTEYRAVMPRLREKVEKSLESLSGSKRLSGRAFFQDATQRWPEEVKDLDAVITSPPFFDSTRFHTANWMRLWFAGWEAEDFKSRPPSFVDERQKASFEIYQPIFQQSAERLKRGGLVLIHLGKSVKCDMAQSLRQIAERYFQVLDTFTESVAHCESHGIRDKGTVTHHQYLLMHRK